MKVLLVQWDERAAAERARGLERAGCEVLCETTDGAAAYRTARRERPDVVLLDLDRRPSHSCQTAAPLARLARPPRLVFVGGSDAARRRAGEEAPTALFVAADDVERAVRQS